MGKPKPFLRLGGATFLERAVAALREGGCAAVWVVAGPGVAGDRVADAARALGATALRNPDADAEQVQSLRIALAALPDDVEGAAVLPVDVPEVEPAVVRAVADAFLRTRAPVVVPARAGRHGHPVLFARATWPRLHGHLPEGARTVVHTADRVEVPVDALAADVDTPDDLRRLRERAE